MTAVAWSGAATAPASLDHVRHVDLHGRTVAYRQDGTGPAVLLVHGLGATMRVWDDVVAAVGAALHGDHRRPPGTRRLGPAGG